MVSGPIGLELGGQIVLDIPNRAILISGGVIMWGMEGDGFDVSTGYSLCSDSWTLEFCAFLLQ